MATAEKRVILILAIQVQGGMESDNRRMLWESDIFDRLCSRGIGK